VATTFHARIMTSAFRLASGSEFYGHRCSAFIDPDEQR
jgi:hypothetical protein